MDIEIGTGYLFKQLFFGISRYLPDYRPSRNRYCAYCILQNFSSALVFGCHQRQVEI